MVQFFFEIVNMPPAYKERILDLVLNSMEAHFAPEDLSRFVGTLLSATCRKIGRLPVLVINEFKHQKRTYESKRDYALGIIRVVEVLIERNAILYAWLRSTSFSGDLDWLYSLCMPSRDEIDSLVSQGTKKFYHPALPGSETLRFTY